MGVTDFLKNAAGLTEKAVLIIGDTSEVEIKEVEAPKPSAGGAGGVDLSRGTDFSMETVKGYLKSALTSEQREKNFELVGEVKKYRFEVQFNPAEISITGYGGENLPHQAFGQAPKPGQEPPKPGERPKRPPRIGSRMASASTRITMNFRVMFDKSPVTNVISNNKAVKLGKALLGVNDGTVQDEIEALHAIARDNSKRLAMFVWGDMIYEGIINSVDSEYLMFNRAGLPIRATASISMLLYGEHDLGKNVDTWRKEYHRDFYSLKEGSPFTRIKL